MRKAITILSLVLAIHGASCAGGIARDKTPGEEPASAASIRAAGCVEKGVESGCVVLTDAKNKTTYTLLFPKGKPAPKVGTAIAFEGEPRGGMSFCMQGRLVDVLSWREAELPCPGKP